MPPGRFLPSLQQALPLEHRDLVPLCLDDRSHLCGEGCRILASLLEPAVFGEIVHGHDFDVQTPELARPKLRLARELAARCKPPAAERKVIGVQRPTFRGREMCFRLRVGSENE